MVLKRNICRGLISLAWILIEAKCQLSFQAPPTIRLSERIWKISDAEKIGSKIAQVYGDGNDGPLVYGLEHLDSSGTKSINSSDKFPFRIDPNTGAVYLNDSLKGRAGENIHLYVTAGNGDLPAKIEVYANIINASHPRSSSISAPGFPGSRNKQTFSLPSFTNNPPREIANNPPPFPGQQQQQPPKQLKTYPDNYGEDSKGQRTDPEKSSSTSTRLRPVETKTTYDNNFPRNNNIDGDKNVLDSSTVATSLDKSSSTNLADGKNSVSPGNEDVDDNSENRLPVDQAVKSRPDLTITIVPVISVCGIFLIVGILAVVFRKKIHLGKPKGNKDDTRKVSANSIITQEDTSIGMQQWRGPRAFSNRYEPWERENNHGQAGHQVSAPTKNSDHWEFPRHRLKFFNILGEGAFGQVWKCEATDIEGKEGCVTVVAVKTLKENANEKEKSDLISELQVMKMLDPHPNVVRLLGCCTEKEPIFLIMEFISKGKLQSYLRNSRAERYYNNMHGQSKSLTSRDLTSFVYQVAKGMEFLSANGIIHRDLAARNVLITDEHTCKVADFGFARDVIASHVYERKSEGRLPIRWMAPESLYDNMFSVKSDVWSFGVLIWEVVTLGSTPYPGLSAAEVMRKVRDGYRLDKPEHCRRELYNIMYYCWDKDPAQRPSFSECVELLEKLLMTETDYIELERFPDHSYYNMMSLSGEKL